MKYFLIVISILFLAGCDIEKDETTAPVPTKIYVEVFTLAPVVNAVVTDASNQVAIYDKEVAKYYFKSSVSYPVSAQATAQTYVDVDYDNTKTATDLNTSNIFSPTLKSFCKEINILTSMYYDQNLSDQNITTYEYSKDITQRFNIDICEDVTTNIKNAKVIFGAYNYVVENTNISMLSDIDADVSKVDEFFDNYLFGISQDLDKIKYYSAYDALVNLDLSRVVRADTIHKPNVSNILRDGLNLENTNSGIDVFDILPYSNHIYLAAGHDELAKVDIDLSNKKFSSDVELLSFGSRLDKQTYAGQDCLFLANSRVGLTSFKIDSNGFTKDANISYYVDENGTKKDFTSKSVTNSNHYISINENKRLLGIATQDKGYYLINIKDNFTGCKPTYTDMNVSIDINASKDFIIQESTGTVIDAIFRDDGTYLYLGHKRDGIYGYKTDILDKNDVTSSKKIFTLKDDAQAYNLKLFNNDNELFVTTDSGVLIYDVGSAVDNLSYVSEYKSEGAEADYYPYIDFYQDYIFFTDGYKGIKVLKLDNSFHPMLCGVEYFAPSNNPYELAKTTSVKYDNGNLYVGITSYGIVKFKLDDILFNHCK